MLLTFAVFSVVSDISCRLACLAARTGSRGAPRALALAAAATNSTAAYSNGPASRLSPRTKRSATQAHIDGVGAHTSHAVIAMLPADGRFARRGTASVNPTLAWQWLLRACVSSRTGPLARRSAASARAQPPKALLAEAFLSRALRSAVRDQHTAEAAMMERDQARAELAAAQAAARELAMRSAHLQEALAASEVQRLQARTAAQAMAERLQELSDGRAQLRSGGGDGGAGAEAHAAGRGGGSGAGFEAAMAELSVLQARSEVAVLGAAAVAGGAGGEALHASDGGDSLVKLQHKARASANPAPPVGPPIPLSEASPTARCIAPCWGISRVQGPLLLFGAERVLRTCAAPNFADSPRVRFK